ncbi:MAG: GGDEF domain-containing protein [Thiomicrorhabdus sp.]|nr:GGDEF domain-containing protein [Thiomicrorhabdus sp.]
MAFLSLSQVFSDRPKSKFALFLGTVVFYFIIFDGLHDKVGNALIIFSAIPVFIVAYCYGMKYGVLASLLVLPINYLLISMAGVDGIDELRVSRFLGLHILILIGSMMLGYSIRMQNLLKDEVERRKETEQRLKYLAHYDQLTGVANRHYGDELMQQMMTKARMQKTRFIIIFIDLNEFKQLNDQYGHYIGDLALQNLANQLKVCVGDDGVVVRNGGDEFLVVLEPCENFETEKEVIETIQRVFSRPLVLAEHVIKLSLSYGTASYPDDADDLESLIKKADSKMYQFKQQKKLGVVENCA